MKKLFYFLLCISTVFVLFSSVDVEASSTTISNGNYYIYSAINDKYAVDLSNGKVKNKQNIWLYGSNQSEAQQWRVTKLSNGYYKIASAKNNNYVLDVTGGSKKKGTNVQLYKYNSKASAQQWIIKDAGGGYFYIISKCNNLSLDVKNGKAKKGQNIQVYTQNKSKAQKFIFTPVVDLNGNTQVETGTYLISSLLKDDFVVRLDELKTKNQNNVHMRNFNGSINEYWYISKLSNGYYTIATERDHRYVIDVRDGGKKRGTNLQLYKYTGSVNQQFKILENNDGSYTFISRTNGLAFDVVNGKTSNKTNLQVYTYNNTKAQKFTLTKQEDTYSENSKELSLDNMTTDANKLMIVAHPDDETLWGSHALYKDKYTVVCVTCGSTRTDRMYEFREVMSKTEDDYIMLGFPDLVNGKKSEWTKELPDINKEIEQVINSKDWDMIVTHNPEGEYGHIHHKMTNQVVTSKADHDKLVYFGKYYKKGKIKNENLLYSLTNDEYKYKQSLLSTYETQESVIKVYQHMVPYEDFKTYNEWYGIDE